VNAERALKQSEERYRNLIEGSIQGILVHDRGRPLFVNQAYATIYGYDEPADMLAMESLDVLIPPDDVERMLSYRAARLRGEAGPASYEHRGMRRDGTLIWLENRSRAIDWNGRRAIQAVVVDITERKRAEQALVAARDEAASASRSKSEFLANVSHELRTPLNAVIGFSEILRREQLGPLGNERYREFAEDIHDGGLHMLDLINDILDLSKIEAGRFELHDEVVAVAELLEAVRRMVHERAQRSRLALAVEIGEIPPRVRVDVRAVRQILFNLLSNAIKFTPEGGRVTLQATVEPDGGLRLEVRDTGVGMAAADIPTALEPFGQVNNVLTRRHHGAGLGLPISRALVELHRGRFLLASEPGVGTIVTVLLPPDRVAA
jgi:two-component system cell cycle sensor histidine kinase PleC